jgi:hypothetical protein
LAGAAKELAGSNNAWRIEKDCSVLPCRSLPLSVNIPTSSSNPIKSPHCRDGLHVFEQLKDWGETTADVLDRPGNRESEPMKKRTKSSYRL